MKPTLLVLAAGMGSRYGGLKQLDPVGPAGEAIIDYSIYDAIRAGFGKIVFVIRRDIEDAFKTSIGSKYAGLIKVEYAYQELNDLPAGFSVPEGRVKPWGTGHAILAAAEVIAEPFAVINADDFYGADSYSKLAAYLETAQDGDYADYCMVGFYLKNTLSEHGSVSRGVCSDDGSGNLTTAEELTKISQTPDGIVNANDDGSVRRLTGSELVSMNMWGFTPSLFENLRKLFIEFLEEQGNEEKSEFYIPFAVNSMIEDGLAKVKIIETPASWFGITYRDDKPSVVSGIAAKVAAGEYPEKLFN